MRPAQTHMDIGERDALVDGYVYWVMASLRVNSIFKSRREGFMRCVFKDDSGLQDVAGIVP